MEDEKKRMTGMLIHSYAAVHAFTAGLLAQTMIGDELALTALTVAMILSISKMNGADWDSAKALKAMGVFLGEYIGVRGASMLMKWIPIIGNAANAAAMFGATEIMGWTAYALMKNHIDPAFMSDTEREDIRNAGKRLYNENSSESKRDYENLSPEKKKELQKMIQKLEKNMPDAEREELLEKLNEIILSSGSAETENEK